MFDMNYFQTDAQADKAIHLSKTRIKKGVAKVLGASIARKVARNGYFILRGKKHIYKLVLYQHRSIVFGTYASRDDNYEDIYWHYCINSITGNYHYHHDNEEVTSCKMCSRDAIENFITWYLLLMASEETFEDIANRVQFYRGDLETFIEMAGMESIHPRYQEL